MSRLDKNDYLEYLKAEEEWYREMQLPAVAYSIEVYVKGKDLTKQDKISIINTLHRHRQRHLYASFLYVESTTACNKDAVRKVLLTGKRGKPVTKPVGRKVASHVHIVVIGDKEHSAWQYANDVKQTIDKRFKQFNHKCAKVVSLGDSIHARNYIAYCNRQADSVRTGGVFCFKEHINKVVKDI